MEIECVGLLLPLTAVPVPLAQTYTFDSFGKLTNSSGSLTNPFRYTAREFDSETSLSGIGERPSLFRHGRVPVVAVYAAAGHRSRAAPAAPGVARDT